MKARPDSGFALFACDDPEASRAFASRVDYRDFVFARQVLRTGDLLADLPVGRRAEPIAQACAALGDRFRELFLETPDTNDGKALASLIRPMTPHLDKALERLGVQVGDEQASLRLHVFFVGGTACHVGTSRVRSSSPWPLGIPRLRMPGGAPSRSTLKLAEAFATFLTPEERTRLLKPGLSAIDLGASPGGWTWQLVHRGLSVIAVDNGAMDAGVMDSGQVKHRREDGLRFRPAAPVDWMVCDIVESPSRIAHLAARWVAEGWCRQSIFNLKLPMKKRREEVLRCREIVAESLAGRPHRLAIRQLYHDREEVTAWLAVGGD